MFCKIEVVIYHPNRGCFPESRTFIRYVGNNYLGYYPGNYINIMYVNNNFTRSLIQ